MGENGGQPSSIGRLLFYSFRNTILWLSILGSPINSAIDRLDCPEPDPVTAGLGCFAYIFPLDSIACVWLAEVLRLRNLRLYEANCLDGGRFDSDGYSFQFAAPVYFWTLHSSYLSWSTCSAICCRTFAIFNKKIDHNLYGYYPSNPNPYFDYDKYGNRVSHSVVLLSYG